MNNFFISRNFIFRNGVGKKEHKTGESQSLEKFQAPGKPKLTPEQASQELAKQRQKALRLLNDPKSKLTVEQKKKLRDSLAGKDAKEQAKNLADQLKKIATEKEYKKMQARLGETQKKFYKLRDEAIKLGQFTKKHETAFAANRKWLTSIETKGFRYPKHPNSPEPPDYLGEFNYTWVRENAKRWKNQIEGQFLDYGKSYMQFKNTHLKANHALYDLVSLEQDMWNAEAILKIKRGMVEPNPEKAELPTKGRFTEAMGNMMFHSGYANSKLGVNTRIE